MTASTWVRRIGIIIAAVALSAATAGCVGDMEAAANKSKGSGQLRYFGGPKSPMWSGQ